MEISDLGGIDSTTMRSNVKYGGTIVSDLYR